MTDETMKRIAADYLAAPHVPDTPEWRAYAAQSQFLFNRFRYMHTDVTLEPTSKADTYATVAALRHDVLVNRHMAVYNEGDFGPGSPLAAPAWVWNGQTVNTVARVVHDWYGHVLGNNTFETFQGELDAWRSERLNYSVHARDVSFTESVGQLCVFYVTGDFVQGPQLCKLLHEGDYVL